MRLADLIPYTSEKLAISDTFVNTVCRSLRPAELLSSNGKGPKSATMTSRDCASLFVSVCAVTTANRTAHELPKWIERCPGLIEHIESYVQNPPRDTSVEFDVDGYCVRFIRKDGKTKTFGKRPDTPSYLTRTVTAKAFSNWLEGLRT